MDAGPDEDAVDACLDDLGVRSVPLLVLTHLHADHVDSLPGVLRRRWVATVETTPVLDPPAGARRVQEAVDRAGVPLGKADFDGYHGYPDGFSWEKVTAPG